MSESVGLSERQVSDFHRDGYLGPLPSFASPGQIEHLATELSGIIHSSTPHPLYGRFSVRDWHLLSTQLLDLLSNPVLVSQLQSLAGPDLTLWRSKIFHKRPKDGPTGWHQEWGAFNGEEIGNDRPSLIPAIAAENWWNLTVWIALTDVGPENSPMRFVRSSHRNRYPIEMVPMPDSEFWHDPFIGITTVREIVDRAKYYSLVLDIDTTKLFEGVDVDTMTLDGAKTHVVNELSKMKAARTLPFDDTAETVINMPMGKGEYVIFTERTMHGAPSNLSDQERLAINARVTTTDTQIYSFRHNGEHIDGSNIDISRHQCILLSGQDRTAGRNLYR